MAGRLYPSSGNPKPRSPILLFVLSLLALSLLFCIFSVFSSPFKSNSFPNPIPDLNQRVEYSFFASLEKFLTTYQTRKSRTVSDDTAGTVSEEDVKNLDELIWKRETEKTHKDLFYPAFSFSYSPIKVYVYDMPSKFTYDLLLLFRTTYRETSNLTSNGSPVHRLIEQHSIDYWLWVDLIALESERLLKNVVRVHVKEEADLFYIPFFTTISYFLLDKQQCKSLYRVKL